MGWKFSVCKQHFHNLNTKIVLLTVFTSFYFDVLTPDGICPSVEVSKHIGGCILAILIFS